MSLLSLRRLFKKINDLKAINMQQHKQNSFITTRSGAILPEPKTQPLGLVAVVAGVSLGLLIGATISKNIANFLEENDLFVPSDDDGDDD
ncbi:essential MCU regulator, mitochondrial [Microplitis demolitor]|uniref:essential MCU regulator, mitochondrial n=1 Tax=Microplitis demolitor TaxID=69319 RepID=UPI0006D5122C|nr:essential MCU regulator, mitochondrial [Microplitis demolitor]